MRLITPREAAEADRYAAEILNIDIITLIESAAAKLFERCLEFKSVTVVSGGGNNGADGLCAAFMLSLHGVKVDIWNIALGGKSSINDNCRYFIGKLKQNDIDINYIFPEASEEEFLRDAFIRSVSRSEAVLECLLGTGFDISKKRESDGRLADIIGIINRNAKYVISADIAAGISGENGCAFKESIKADETITFGFPKPGNVIMPGKKHCGRLKIESIAVPDGAYCLESEREFMGAGELGDAARLLPGRDSYGHKGNFGRILILAGSEGMTGAAALAAEACLKSGAGLVYIAAPRGLLQIYETLLPAAVKVPVGAYADLYLKTAHAKQLAELSCGMDAVVAGPGIGRRDETAQFLTDFLKNTSCGKIVLDADALRILAEAKDDAGLKAALKNRNTVMTPHAGELAALLGSTVTVSEVDENRLLSASRCAAEYGCCVVCKGNDTITLRSLNEYTVNGSGNSGMATGGSGDVLSGIIGALAAVSDDIYNAARLGVYIHGMAGDIAAMKLTEYCVTAQDMIDFLPEAFGILKNVKY